MSYLLLTGATGLLGQYLLVDLLRSGRNVACLVRSKPGADARLRIDHQLRRWETQFGCALRRPVVLAGDLNCEHLGLAPSDAAWLRGHCGGVVHSAASLEFLENTKSGEPYRTNADGTSRLLAAAATFACREFHLVSTAYVCGKSGGTITPRRIDEIHSFSNDYERSKAAAERMTLASDTVGVVTIYRPSIIVGDSRTGYTSTYQGFYAPLQAGHALAKAYGFLPTAGVPFLEQMNLCGEETKNLVPIDWVSAVITAIIERPAAHGRIYHVTNLHPVSVRELDEIYTTAIAESAPPPATAQQVRVRSADDEREFRDKLAVYATYFRDDPLFDASDTAAVVDLPCPEVDRTLLTMLCRRAIADGFGRPRPRTAPPEFDVAQIMKGLAAEKSVAPPAARSAAFNLTVTGPGGGEWQVTTNDDRAVGVTLGHGTPELPHGYLAVATLQKVVLEEIDVDQSVRSGKLVLECVRGDDAARIKQSLRLLATALAVRYDVTAQVAPPLPLLEHASAPREVAG